MKTRVVLPLLLVCVICFALAAADDSVIYVRLSDITTLDPGKTTDSYSGEVVANIFEGLIGYNMETRTFVPRLATKWEVHDGGRRWIFTLRRGVVFHDNRPFNAESVVYSFRKRMEGFEDEYPEWEVFFSTIIGVRALGDHTVEFTLKRPFAPFLIILTMPEAYMVPRGAYDSPEFIPTGTGPFKLSTRTIGERIVLSRNDRYWGKKIEISKVVFKIVPNPGRRVRQVKTGQAHVAGIRSAGEYRELIGSRDLKIMTQPANNTTFLAFNTSKTPFNKIEVRLAVAHLIDKKTLIRQVFQRFATPATTPLPPKFPGFNPKIPHYPFDLERAKTLLSRAGLSAGFTCKILFLKDDEGERRIVDAFIRNAARIGITIEKDPKSFQDIMNTVSAKSHEILLRGWNAGPDPDLFLFPNFTSDAGNMNLALYSNKELNTLLKKARETLDRAAREKMYHRAQEIIFLEVPWIPLYHRHDLTVHNRRLKNLIVDTFSFILFKDSFWEER